MIAWKPALTTSVFVGCIGVGAALVLGSLMPFASSWVWFFEFPSHFRIQNAIALSAVSAMLLLIKRWKLASVFLGVAALNASVLLPFYLGGSSGPHENQHSFSMVLFNVNSTTGSPDAVFAYLEQGNFDLVILQEYSARWHEVMRNLEVPHRLVHIREDNFGMALFSRIPLGVSDVFYVQDSTLPSLRAELLLEDQTVHILAIHPVPPVRQDYQERRDRMLKQVGALGIPGERYIVAGDMNTTPWSAQILELRKELGLSDSAHGSGFHPTWPVGIPWLSTVLDHVFYRGLHVVDRKVGEPFGSDHRPIEVTFSLSGED